MAQHRRTPQGDQPPCGSVRTCTTYRDELARHRVITSDGYDYVVATTFERREQQPYLTGAYPIIRGYLVMMRQPLFEVRSENETTAREQHEQLVSVLAEAGIKVVRARRTLAARRMAEKREALAEAQHRALNDATHKVEVIRPRAVAPTVVAIRTRDESNIDPALI